MVRMRADIREDEAPEPALAKLRTSVEEHVPDPDERSWLEPRLAHLLGLAERTAPDREDLFSAWRLFFERIADNRPVILVFEDLQWADTGLLDFIEYLLEWSRNHPIFVLALSRPELAERRPGFGAAGRNLTTISLEPLAAAAMERLLDGFVPGLPGGLRSQILSRAEGVPLYAVETIRMLLDRGLLAREGDVYRPTGEIESLDVPETLQALVSARLDGLAPEERRLLQDAAVLGKSFTKAGLAALSGQPEAEIERLVTGLVRKEVFSVQADPRSPERGQYSFLQDLLKRVAYETLAKQERKARHLAAAAHLGHAYGAGEQEIVEVIAAHYVDAYRAAPDAEDATEIKTMAKQMLTRAGERAASLAANDEAGHYFERAAELSDDVAVQAELLERAGKTAWASGQVDRARTHFERAMELFETEGLTHPAARVSALLGVVEWRATHLDDALERMERAFETLSGDEPDEDLATLAAELGRLHYFRGDLELADRRIETAVQVAEYLWLPEVLAQALNTQGILASWRGRSEQSLALMKHALTIALEHDLAAAALRAYNNLGDLLDRRDRNEEAIEIHLSGVALARKTGDRMQGWRLTAELAWCLQRVGRWDEALVYASEIPSEQRLWALSELSAEVEIATGRGDLESAERVLDEMSALGESADVQEREALLAATATCRRAAGRYEEAHAAAQEALTHNATYGLQLTVDAKIAYGEALESALALGRLGDVEDVIARIDAIPPGVRPPSLRAQAARFQARLRAARGEHATAEQGFKTAEAIFREHGFVFPLAVTQLEHGEWLVAQGRPEDAEALLREARETFERLQAAPYVARVDALGTGLAAVD
jgi:tetratricopeptide (TPR) repeat protein